MRMNNVFLSYTLTPLTPTYGNRNKFLLQKQSAICEGDVANDSKVATTVHIGTHLDMPYHFYDDGATIEKYDANFFVFEANEILFIELKPDPNAYVIAEELVEAIEARKQTNQTDVSGVRLLLVKTGICHQREHESFWKYNYGFDPSLAEYFRKTFPHIAIFGFDSISVSSWQNRTLGRKAHKAFLDPQCPILLLEDVDLRFIRQETTFKQIVIAPLRIAHSDGIPCSIVASISDETTNGSVL